MKKPTRPIGTCAFDDETPCPSVLDCLMQGCTLHPEKCYPAKESNIGREPK